MENLDPDLFIGPQTKAKVHHDGDPWRGHSAWTKTWRDARRMCSKEHSKRNHKQRYRCWTTLTTITIQIKLRFWMTWKITRNCSIAFKMYFHRHAPPLPLHRSTLHHQRLTKEQTEITLIHPLRENKKLLVLDLDYTLFDMKSTADNLLGTQHHHHHNTHPDNIFGRTQKTVRWWDAGMF